MMKTKLNSTIQNDNKIYTLVQRNEKALLYTVETLDGQSLGYVVFMSMVESTGNEVFPNNKAFDNRWAFSTNNKERAEYWFDGITNGDIPVPQVDPVTGDRLPDPTDDSLPDDEETESNEETPVTDETVENPVVETVETQTVTDLTGFKEIVNLDNLPVETDQVIETPVTEVSMVETVKAPVVETVESINPLETVDTVETPVTVENTVKTGKRGRKRVVHPVYLIPSGEFTRHQFAALNGLKPANSQSYGALMNEVKMGRVVELRKVPSVRGKPHSVYSGVTVSMTQPETVQPVQSQPETVTQ